MTSSSRSVRPCSVASGPTSVASAIGSPTVSARIRAVNPARNSSYTAVCTMKRFAAMQDWPLFCTRAVTARAIAARTSAEGSTRNGSLPPSSRTVFFTSSPATRATARPAPSLPVSVTATIRSSRISASTAREGISRVWKQPCGNPARVNSSSRASAVRGTFEACLSRPTLPAISAGAANRITCQNGKFHGITASTGPSGR